MPVAVPGNCSGTMGRLVQSSGEVAASTADCNGRGTAQCQCAGAAVGHHPAAGGCRAVETGEECRIVQRRGEARENGLDLHAVLAENTGRRSFRHQFPQISCGTIPTHPKVESLVEAAPSRQRALPRLKLVIGVCKFPQRLPFKWKSSQLSATGSATAGSDRYGHRRLTRDASTRAASIWRGMQVARHRTAIRHVLHRLRSTTDLQTSIAFGQRVWKRQPGGGRSALGISPTMICWPRCASISGSAIGTAASSACV